MNSMGVIFLKNRRLRMRRAISNALELPQEMFHGTSSVTLTSDCEALISGCRRVKEYKCDVVRLSLCDNEVTITGEGLSMKTFFGTQILVCGKIQEVKLG